MKKGPRIYPIKKPPIIAAIGNNPKMIVICIIMLSPGNNDVILGTFVTIKLIIEKEAIAVM